MSTPPDRWAHFARTKDGLYHVCIVSPGITDLTVADARCGADVRAARFFAYRAGTNYLVPHQCPKCTAGDA